MSESLPKRTRGHVLEKLSRQHVEGVFPAEWIVRSAPPDYGLDLRVELVSGESVTGAEFSIQLKATDRLKTSGDDVLHRCKVSTANYFRQRLEPVMYLVYDAPEDKAYWLWIKPYLQELDQSRPTWCKHKTVGLRIPKANCLTLETVPAIADYVQAWRERLLFLQANFIDAQTIDTFAPPTSLTEPLAQDPVVVVDRLLKDGLLEFVDPDEPPEQVLGRINVPELQAMLKARNLDPSGTHQQLVHRLANVDEHALYRAALRKTPLQCSEQTRQVSEDYLTENGSSLQSQLDLPDEWWRKFLERAAEWTAAGLVGAAVYKALTASEAEVLAGTPESARKQFSLRTSRLPIEPELVRIPAGPFLMGTSDRQIRWLRLRFKWAREFDFSDEQPQHTVRLPTYHIGRYPVTNAQYAAFVQDTGRDPPDNWSGGRYPAGRADHPVRYVLWHAALAYVAWLRDRAGQPYRLPTEAEWEKAARGARGRIWPWGDRSPNRNLCNFGRQEEGTTPVGRYSPHGDSPYGCADMAGSVWEWCITPFHRPYPYDAGDAREEPSGDSSRVLRGGAWLSSPNRVRCAVRYYYSPPARAIIDAGFRVARGPLT